MPVLDDRYVVANSLSEAWLDAVRCLDVLPKHKAVHLLVRIREPLTEIPLIRSEAQRLIDYRSSSHPDDPYYDIETTRNTIFPVAWAKRHPTSEALVEHYRKMYQRGSGLRGFAANQYGTYFGRITSFPRSDDEVSDQLTEAIRKLRKEIATGAPKSSRYEINIYCEAKDTGARGFPCLAHLSLHLDDGSLHMQAIYRNESLLSRAYGNYLGLAALLEYVADEVKVNIGELLITAGHAELEGGMQKEVHRMLAKFS